MMANKHYYSTEGHYFKKTGVHFVKKCSEPFVDIDLNKLDQTIYGFGGGITNASLHVFCEMNTFQQLRFVGLVYGENGLKYSWGRIPIGTCDFSYDMYDYTTKEDLSDFIIHPYEDTLLYFLHLIKNFHTNIHLVGAVWSPPAMFKDNNEKVGGHLLTKYYDNYASYISKFLDEFQQEDLPFAAISINNEPEADVPWESCYYTVSEEAKFAKVLRKTLDDNGHNEVAIAIFDHNRDHLYNWVKESFTKYKTEDIFSVIAYHWYAGESEEVGKVHADYPSKTIIFSEGCIEGFKKAEYFKYSSALRYFKNYINDINNGTSIFLDWNILLDKEGGPNHVGNYCEAPLMYDDELQNIIINPSYYAIMHFSAFIANGMKRVVVSNNISNVTIAAFTDNSGKVVIEILNEGEERDLYFRLNGAFIRTHVLKNSLNTLIIETK